MLLNSYGSSHIVINNDYYCPYLAGISLDLETVFIDQRVPRYTVTKNGRLRDNFKYLAKHECREAYAEKFLHYKYPYAHEFYGTASERESVEADGFNWNEYQTFMLDLVKKFKKIPQGGKIPPTLWLKPELDTHDYYDYNKYSAEEKQEQQHV